jgi:hypothetical protein
MNSVQGNIVVKEEAVIKKEPVVMGRIPAFDQDGKLIDGKVLLNPYETFGSFDNVARYWSPIFSSMASIGNSSNLSSNLITYIPFLVERDLEITELALSQNMGGSANSKMLIGIIRTKDNRSPLIGKVAFQSQEISIDNTGDKIVAGISIFLNAGLYYFALQHNSNNPIRFRGITTTQMKPLLYLPSLTSPGWVHSATIFKPYQSTFEDDESIAANFSAGLGFSAPLFFFKSNHR